jgi:chemotaxis protein methyltransferase CheR
MNAALAEIAGLVAAECGIRLSGDSHAALRAAITRLDAGNPCEVLDTLRDPRERTLLTRLVQEVAVHETFFLRESAPLEGIPWRRLFAQAAARGDSSVRVWCAACSTGEEAYTLAMLAAEAFAPTPAPVRILATDLSDGALASASAGRYAKRAMRLVDDARRARWFTTHGSAHVVSPELRRIVELRRHNLIQDTLPPLGEAPFDLVVCRNVLIYFSPDDVERVVRSLEQSVRRDGRLVLGSADTLAVTSARMAREATPPSRPVQQRTRRLRRPLRHAPPPEPAVTDDADALFLRGVAQLEEGTPTEAAETLRAALYLRPSFALAAFQLGRAHDALGDASAARRAYRQTLRSLDAHDPNDALLEQVDAGDVVAACRARLAVLDERTLR